jgi:hypothetical protein
MSAPDNGVENTGDNLRRVAQETGQAGDEHLQLPPEDPGFATPPLEGPAPTELPD